MRNQSRFPWNQARKSAQPSSPTHFYNVWRNFWGKSRGDQREIRKSRTPKLLVADPSTYTNLMKHGSAETLGAMDTCDLSPSAPGLDPECSLHVYHFANLPYVQSQDHTHLFMWPWCHLKMLYGLLVQEPLTHVRKYGLWKQPLWTVVEVYVSIGWTHWRERSTK